MIAGPISVQREPRWWCAQDDADTVASTQDVLGAPLIIQVFTLIVPVFPVILFAATGLRRAAVPAQQFGLARIGPESRTHWPPALAWVKCG
jgi:hypothetical protein